MVTRSDFGAARPAAGQPAYPSDETAAVRRAPSADRIAALSALVESITEQIDVIEGAARRGAAPRQPAAPNDPAAPSFHRAEPQPPVEPPRMSAPPQPDRLGEIEARLSALAAQMTPGNRPAATPAAAPAAARGEPARAPAPQPGGLQSAIAQISARQQAIDSEAGRLAAVDSIAIEDAITALRTDIATLGRRIGTEARRSEEMDKALRADFAARIEQMPRDGSASFDELRSHLAEIRQAIEASARETTLASIEAGYSHVIQRLDDITRRVPERGLFDALAGEVGRLGAAIERAQPFRSMEGELEDIRNAIASLAATRIDTGIERQIAELRQTVERLAAIPRERVDLGPIERELAVIRREVDGFAKGTDPVLLLRLDQQVSAIHALLEQVSARSASGGEAAISRLEERIDALSGRFDAIVDLPGLQPSADSSAATVAAIDSLRGDLSEIRDHIVTREPVRFDAIDQQMRALMERLDAATSRDDSQSLAQLEAQVAALAEKLTDAAPGADALQKVEENLDRMQSLIGDSRRETIEAARDAARSTLSEFAGQLPSYPDENLIRALREDLRNLQAASMSSDRHNHETLEAVHDTLAKVVERITQLEADERASEPQTPVRRYAELPEDHRPLAPGSGKPDLSLRGDLLPQPEPQAELSPRTGDRKADFIAAARRAAQAAQAETAKETARMRKSDRKAAALATSADPAEAAEDGEPAEQRPGPLARIGSVFRTRRRPLMLAIAAIVLALGAAKYGPPVGERLMLLSGESMPLDYQATASVAEAPARPAAPAAAPQAGGSALAAGPALVAPASDASLAFQPASAMASPMTAASAVPAVMLPPGEPAAAADPAAVVTPASLTAAAPSVPLNVAMVKGEASKGNATAAFELGKLYAEGLGVRPDMAVSVQWYARAAKGGLAVAQYRLGSLYERGEGVKRDPAAAESWYRKASAQGNARATHNLAVMVSEGANGAPDYVAAAELFVTAGNLGVADSQYNLGVLYARGLGVKVDLVQSYKWFALAAQQGDVDAGKRRDEVAKALKADELASARAAVQAFKPQTPDPQANTEPSPKAEWMQTAETAAPFDGASLDGANIAGAKG